MGRDIISQESIESMVSRINSINYLKYHIGIIAIDYIIVFWFSFIYFKANDYNNKINYMKRENSLDETNVNIFK